MRNALRGLRVWIFVICVVFVSAPAWAADEKLPDKFMFRLGGYHARNVSSIVRLDSNYSIGAYIDFQETLGGDSESTVLRADGLYRFNDKHALGFSWYALKFTGSRDVSIDIDWGGLPPITAGSHVDSELRFDVYKLNYQYSLFHNEKAELGASLGFHIMKTFAGLNATGIGQSKSEAVTAPLPVFGLFADYNFTPKFSAFYNYQFFFINYEDRVKGGLQDFMIGMEYRLFRHVALGAAYNRFGLSMEAKGDSAKLFLETSWNGGMLYGTVYF